MPTSCLWVGPLKESPGSSAVLPVSCHAFPHSVQHREVELRAQQVYTGNWPHMLSDAMQAGTKATWPRRRGAATLASSTCHPLHCMDWWAFCYFTACYIVHNTFFFFFTETWGLLGTGDSWRIVGGFRIEMWGGVWRQGVGSGGWGRWGSFHASCRTSDMLVGQYYGAGYQMVMPNIVWRCQKIPPPPFFIFYFIIFASAD